MRHYPRLIMRNSIPLQGNRFEKEETFYCKHESRRFSDSLWNGCGVVLDNRNKERILYSSDEGHCLINAGTGAGKTRRILIPTAKGCIKQRKSIFAIDPKGELVKYLKEDLLRSGYDILVYDLRHPRESNKYNPLTVIETNYRSTSKDSQDWALMRLRELLVGMAKNYSGKDPYFANSPGEFAFGISLLILDKALAPNSLSFENISFVSKDFEMWVRNGGLSANDRKWRKYADYYNSLPADVQNSIKSFIQPNAKSTFENLISMLYTILSPFIGNRALIEMMSSSDFDFTEMGKRPVAVFTIIPDETTAYYSIAALMLSEAYMCLLKDLGDEGVLKNKVVFLLDEFGTLCASSSNLLPQFPSWISAARSRGISIVIALQSFSQLQKGYPDDYETILNNMSVSIFMRGSCVDDLEYVERLAGNRISTFGGISTPLVPKEKLLTLPIGKTLIMSKNSKPFMGYVHDFTEMDFQFKQSSSGKGKVLAPGKNKGLKITWESLMNQSDTEPTEDLDEIFVDIADIFEPISIGNTIKLPYKDAGYLECLIEHAIPKQFVYKNSKEDVSFEIIREILLYRNWTKKSEIIAFAESLAKASSMKGYPERLRDFYREALNYLEELSFKDIKAMISDFKGPDFE